jgi:hypothetical protein
LVFYSTLVATAQKEKALMTAEENMELMQTLVVCLVID